MRLPVVAQQLQRSLRQRDVTVFRALAVAHVNHHPRAVDVGDPQVGAFLQAQTAGVDGRETDSVAWQSDATRESGALPPG